MKIAVISSGHIPSQWAHSITTMKMANAFSKLGHDVEVLTVERFIEAKNKKKIKNIHEFYGIDSKIRVRYFKDNPLFYFEEVKPLNFILRLLRKITLNRIRYISDPEKKISEYCKNNKVDLCYCRAYRVVYYNIENEIPTIMESHTPDVKHPDLKKVLKKANSKYFKGLITISEKLKENFIKAGVPQEKILVLHDGVDIERFQKLPTKLEIRKVLNLPINKKIVVYSGSLFPDKGIEHILLVAKELPNVLFLLVGGPEKEKERWRNYARSHGIENVQFIGFVENNKVPLYLKAADVLIMPYKTDQKIKIMDLESTSPLKLFEYMAAKRPIISTNIPAISRVITHEVNGLLAKPNNIHELKKFVEVALKDKKLSKKLAENAYKDVQKYEWKERCKRILLHFLMRA